MGTWLKRKWPVMATAVGRLTGKSTISAAGHGRDEYDRVAVGERLRPFAEFSVHCDAQHLRREGERVACFQLFIQLARGAGVGDERFLTAAGLFAQQRVVLH